MTDRDEPRELGKYVGADPLLESSLRELSVEDRRELTRRAADAQLDLEISAAEARGRHRASGADLKNTIDAVRELENTTKADYTVRTETKTASGKTTIEVRKSPNQTIMIVVIVLGIAAFLFLKH
jgi:hypothetical protein